MYLNIIFFFLFKTIISYIKFSFIIEEDIYAESYIEKIMKTPLKFNIKIGKPIQLVPIYIKIDERYSYLSGTAISKHIYNEKKSSTYQKKESEKTYYDTSFINGIPSIETFQFETNKNKIIEFTNFTFILATNESRKLDINSGVLGLKLTQYTYDKDGYFLYELKYKGLTDSYSWTIKLKNDKEGDIYIGEYPHEFDTSNYNINNYKSTRVGNEAGKPTWNMIFDRVYFGENNKIEEEVQAIINYESGVIEGVSSFIKEVGENYFNQYLDKECFFQRTKVSNYYYYICDTSIDITKFPKLIFFNRDMNMNFELNYKDLFVKKNGKYHFLIVFYVMNTFKWTFGRPFLKKYQMVFDHDRKLIGTYIHIGRSFPWNTFIIIILGLIIIALVYYIIMYFKNRPKRIKANELLEDLDYLTR